MCSMKYWWREGDDAKNIKLLEQASAAPYGSVFFEHAQNEKHVESILEKKAESANLLFSERHNCAFTKKKFGIFVYCSLFRWQNLYATHFQIDGNDIWFLLISIICIKGND